MSATEKAHWLGWGISSRINDNGEEQLKAMDRLVQHPDMKGTVHTHAIQLWLHARVAIAALQPFQSKWSPSADVPFHYQFTVHKMPSIPFSYPQTHPPHLPSLIIIYVLLYVCNVCMCMYVYLPGVRYRRVGETYSTAPIFLSHTINWNSPGTR